MNHRIQVFDRRNGTFIRKWGSRGNGVGQFDYPYGVSVSSDISGAGSQMIYITDSNNKRVVCYHSDGRIVRERELSIDLRCPKGIVFDNNTSNGVGMLYVSDSGNHSIQQYQIDGCFVRKWGWCRGKGDNYLNSPRGIAMGMNGLLYVTDFCNDRIVVIDVNA